MKRRGLVTVALTAALLLGISINSFAAEWKQDNKGWWYQEDDGSYPVSTWKDVNGKQYYFGADGYMWHDTTTPDGYKVGSDGAWIDSETIPTQKQSTSEKTDIDMELLMVHKPISLPHDIKDMIENKILEWGKDLYIQNANGKQVQVKDWIYTVVGSRLLRLNGTLAPDSFKLGEPYPDDLWNRVYFIRVKADGSVVEVLKDFSKPGSILDFSRVEFSSQGKVCISVDGYYQYDIQNNQFRQTSKEENEALLVKGVYNTVDNLYYDYKDNTLIVKNYKNEIIKEKRMIIDVPEIHESGYSTKTSSISRANGDTLTFFVLLNKGGLNFEKGTVEDMSQKSFQIEVDKNSGNVNRVIPSN